MALKYIMALWKGNNHEGQICEPKNCGRRRDDWATKLKYILAACLACTAIHHGAAQAAPNNSVIDALNKAERARQEVAAKKAAGARAAKQRALEEAKVNAARQQANREAASARQLRERQAEEARRKAAEKEAQQRRINELNEICIRDVQLRNQRLKTVQASIAALYNPQITPEPKLRETGEPKDDIILANAYYKFNELRSAIDLLENSIAKDVPEAKLIISKAYFQKALDIEYYSFSLKDKRKAIPYFSKAKDVLGINPTGPLLAYRTYMDGHIASARQQHAAAKESLLASYKAGSDDAAWFIALNYPDLSVDGSIGDDIFWLKRAVELGNVKAKFRLFHRISQNTSREQGIDGAKARDLAAMFQSALEGDYGLLTYSHWSEVSPIADDSNPFIVLLNDLEIKDPMSFSHVAESLVKSNFWIEKYMKENPFRTGISGSRGGIIVLLYKISRLNRFGIGVEKDLYKAYVYRDMALNLANFAKSNLAKFGGRLFDVTPDMKQNAQAADKILKLASDDNANDPDFNSYFLRSCG